MITKPTASAAVFTDPTTATTAFTADVDGAYVIELVVNDGMVDSAPARTTIVSGNGPPVANAGADQIVNFGSTVRADRTDKDVCPGTVPHRDGHRQPRHG